MKFKENFRAKLDLIFKLKNYIRITAIQENGVECEWKTFSDKLKNALPDFANNIYIFLLKYL